MGQPERSSSFCYGHITAHRFSYLAPSSPELSRAVRLSRRLCLEFANRALRLTLPRLQRARWPADHPQRPRMVHHCAAERRSLLGCKIVTVLPPLGQALKRSVDSTDETLVGR